MINENLKRSLKGFLKNSNFIEIPAVNPLLILVHRLTFPSNFSPRWKGRKNREIKKEKRKNLKICIQKFSLTASHHKIPSKTFHTYNFITLPSPPPTHLSQFATSFVQVLFTIRKYYFIFSIFFLFVYSGAYWYKLPTWKISQFVWIEMFLFYKY